MLKVLKNFVILFVISIISLNSFAVTAKKKPAAKPAIKKAAVKPTAKKAASTPSAKKAPTKRTPTKPAKKKRKPKQRPFKLNLDSYGAYLTTENKLLGSKNPHKVLTTSSVSKVFTTQWALDRLGPDFRFNVKVYMTPRANMPGVWNVHLSSDHHPYFDRTVFAKISAYLATRGIKDIETLTFDEGVKFVVDSESECALACDLPTDYPSLDAVKSNLRHVGNKTLNIGTIKYWPSAKVNARGFRPIQGLTKSAVFYSDKLVNVLHKLNSNSNNHAANQVFLKLGGAKAYALYIPKMFRRAQPGQLVMNNGSGNPIYIDNKKVYNRATTSLVLQAIAFIHEYMKPYGGISHVLALAAPDEQNTLRGFYAQRDILKDRLVAKTGTTWDAITLAGILSTSHGPMAFYFNIDINAKNQAQADVAARNARIEIRAYLVGMMEAVGPGPKFE